MFAIFIATPLLFIILVSFLLLQINIYNIYVY